MPAVSFGSRPRNRKISSRPRKVPDIALSPGTVQVASAAKASRNANPSFRAKASKMRRTSASFSARATAALPPIDQALDVRPLRVGEGIACEQTSSLGRIVVCDRCFEMLTFRGRLAELAVQPPQQADR